MLSSWKQIILFFVYSFSCVVGELNRAERKDTDKNAVKCNNYASIWDMDNVSISLRRLFLLIFAFTSFFYVNFNAFYYTTSINGISLLIREKFAYMIMSILNYESGYI